MIISISDWIPFSGPGYQAEAILLAKSGRKFQMLETCGFRWLVNTWPEFDGIGKAYRMIPDGEFLCDMLK